MKTNKIIFIALGHMILLPAFLVWAEGGDGVRSPTGGFIPVQDVEIVSQEMGLDLPSPIGPRELIPEKETSPLSPLDPGMEHINKTLLLHPELNDWVMTLKSRDRDYFYQMSAKLISEWIVAEGQHESSFKEMGPKGPQGQAKLVSWQETSLQEGQVSGYETSQAPENQSFLDALVRYVVRQAVRDAREAVQNTLTQAAREASRSSYREHLQNLEKSRQETAVKHKKPSAPVSSVEPLFHPSSEVKDLRLLIGQLSSVLALSQSAGVSHPWIRWMEGAQLTRSLADYQALRQEVLQSMKSFRLSDLENPLGDASQEKTVRLRNLFGKILQWRLEALKESKSRETAEIQKMALPPL